MCPVAIHGAAAAATRSSPALQAGPRTGRFRRRSSFHDWRGSYRASKLWRTAGLRTWDESRAIGLTGERHIDAVFVSRDALLAGAVSRIRMVTDDRLRETRDEPFASDHYPIAATFAFSEGEGAAEL